MTERLRILVIHGFGSPREAWDDFSKILGDYYEVSKFKITGLDSPINSREYLINPLRTLAMELYFNILYHEYDILIAHSVGCSILTKAIELFPELLNKRIIMIAPITEDTHCMKFVKLPTMILSRILKRISDLYKRERDFKIIDFKVAVKLIKQAAKVKLNDSNRIQYIFMQNDNLVNHRKIMKIIEKEVIKGEDHYIYKDNPSKLLDVILKYV